MVFRKLAPLTIVFTALYGMVAPRACSQETPKLPSLDNYPPAVVQYLLAQFDQQRKQLETSGIPVNEEQLANWNACAGSEENAHPTYVAAFTAKVLSERLRLLSEAAALPCYQYPVKSGFFAWLFGGTKDPSSGMTDTTRLLASEISVQMALVDSERAVQQAEAGIGFIGHFAKAPITLVQLSRYACLELLLGSFQDMLSSMTLSEAQLVRLDQALARAYDPAVLARTWFGEKALYGQADPFESCEIIHIFEARSRAQLLAARAAIAVERYKLASGVMPAALADLVPGYLPEVPMDPFNGEPLRFATSEVAYAIFSVDDDGIACPEPLDVVRGEERSMIRVLVLKTPKPLSQLYYEASSNVEVSYGFGQQKAIELVARRAGKSLMQQGVEGSIVMLTAGEIDGGMAVMLDSVRSMEKPIKWTPILAAFWVKGGTVHTVNAWARDLMPDLPPAPEAITFDRVRDVVH